MTNPADVARERIIALRAEIAELERFLDLYFRLSGSADPVVAASSQALALPSQESGKGIVSLAVENGDKSAAPVEKRRERARPEAFAEHMERIIRDAGRPMTRGEIVKALQARDIAIPSDDPARYLGTIAWRHKGTFVNIEGKGYWLRNDIQKHVPGVPPNTPYSDPDAEEDEAIS